MTIKTINSHCVAVHTEDTNGNFSCTVFSYDTPVFRVNSDNTFSRLWNGWSATTQRDINKAVNVGLTKKMWDEMEVEA